MIIDNIDWRLYVFFTLIMASFSDESKVKCENQGELHRNVFPASNTSNIIHSDETTFVVAPMSIWLEDKGISSIQDRLTEMGILVLGDIQLLKAEFDDNTDDDIVAFKLSLIHI